ncbi:MAG TPA: hypothetical protein VFO34_10595 [Candidatus Acidoferrales bacterium]|nr:hypothetical protein [Candidatus Acidoferrales bacterium]
MKSRPNPRLHLLVCALVVLAGAPAARAQEERPIVTAGPSLGNAFSLLYGLHFQDARDRIAAFEAGQPENPLGPSAEAASYLFEEFFAQGVLTSEFFLDDKKLLDGKPMTPDPERRKNFFAAIEKARKLAQARLKSNANDPDSLLALSMADGMTGDFQCVIERHQMDSLKNMKEAQQYADKLLAVAPDRADAYLPLGAGNYIIGCLPGYKRAFLWFGGIHGDRNAGMDQLRIAAEKGEYLRPFARLLLALAALREKQPDVARTELAALVVEFPDNPLFARELRKVNLVRATSE